MSFLKKFRGDTPDPHSGRWRPLPHPSPARPLAGRGAQAPRCWDPNIGPPQLFSRGCALDSTVVYRALISTVAGCWWHRRLDAVLQQPTVTEADKTTISESLYTVIHYGINYKKFAFEAERRMVPLQSATDEFLVSHRQQRKDNGKTM